MPEVVFVSYSKENSKYDSYLRDFIAKLRIDIHQECPGEAVSPAEVLFFDSDNIETGEDWVLRIAASVSSCKVLVAFCSPHFVSNRFCGKEVQVFLERLRQWQAQNGRTPARTIITVLWIDTEVPTALANYQFDEAILPREYRTHGLRTLCQLKLFDDQKKQVAIALAKRICKALRQNLTPLNAIPHFDEIPNAFEARTVGARYGVAVVNLLKGGANPLALDVLMAEVCGAMLPYRMLMIDKHFPQTVRAAKSNREAVLVVADLPTLTNPLFQASVKAVDEAGGGQAGLVVVGSQQDVPQQHITLQGAFPTSYAAFWERTLDHTGLAGLRKSLSEVMAKLRDRLVREDPSRPADDRAIVQAAEAAGIPIEQKPILTGPEGPR